MASRQACASAEALSFDRPLVRTSAARACIAARSSLEKPPVVLFLVVGLVFRVVVMTG